MNKESVAFCRKVDNHLKVRRRRSMALLERGGQQREQPNIDIHFTLDISF